MDPDMVRQQEEAEREALAASLRPKPDIKDNAAPLGRLKGGETMGGTTSLASPPSTDTREPPNERSLLASLGIIELEAGRPDETGSGLDRLDRWHPPGREKKRRVLRIFGLLWRGFKQPKPD